jgi:outer membrane immunogenic protein
VTAGLAVTHMKYHALFTDTFATAHENAVVKQNMTGWTVGGGAEYQFGMHWSVKAEYLYADFGRMSVTSTNLTAFTPPTAYPVNVFTHSADLHAHIARAGFNWRF